jgi:hypothetical protein
MSRDFYLLTHLVHRAEGAMRELPGANMFAKGNKQSIDLHPVAAGQLLF